MASLSGLKRFGGTPSPPSEGAFDCLVARDAVPAGRGIFCLFFCLCSDSPTSASRLEKRGGAIRLQGNIITLCHNIVLQQ
jgi:hypothetical protein